MAIPDDLLDALMKVCKKPEDLIGENGLLKQLTKRLLEQAMQAEMTDHLGYEKHAPAGKNSGNSRNGSHKKTVKGEFGQMDMAVPRDRNSTFEPVILPKGESRFTGFDDKIISLYARGMTTCDIQAHLEEIYGIEVSPTLVSQFTHEVTDRGSSARKWPRISRPFTRLRPSIRPRPIWSGSRPSGTRRIRPSANPGAGTESGSSPCFPTRRRSERPSTPPMRSSL